VPRRSIDGPVPHQHHTLGLSSNHLYLNHRILPHTTVLPIHTLQLRLVVHQEVLRLIETDLHFATRNAAEVQDKDDV
jgi:hypothetical protein